MITGSRLEGILRPPNEQARRLVVLAGYGSPAMAHRQLEILHKEHQGDVSIILILGMAIQDGITSSSHLAFRNLTNEAAGLFSCRYVVSDPPVHSKVYVWLNETGQAVRAFAGSANYSQSALLTGGTVEVMYEADPPEAWKHVMLAYERSRSCLDERVEDMISIVPDLPWQSRHPRNATQDLADQVAEGLTTAYHSVHLSLLQGDREIHKKSGLNWGQRDRRDKDQAYIPVPSSIARMNFFPPSGTHFTLRTDDGQVINCTVAQQGDKAIESTRSNAILGRYFRDRLGLPSGAFVQKADLDRYGRSDVTIARLTDDTYFMDFSI